MNDDAPTEKHRIKQFHDSREGVVGRCCGKVLWEGVVGRSAFGQSESFSELFLSDLVKLFPEFIELDTKNDKILNHKDNSTKMLLGMAISPGIGQFFKGFEVFRETSEVVNFFRISGPFRRLTKLYIAFRLIFNSYILGFSWIGTL
jgi:hypothetical protein